VNRGRDREFGGLLLLELRQRQQMVVSRPLFRIGKDSVRADDLPELQRGIGITGPDVGMAAFDGITERRPEGFGVVVGKRSEQIVKGFHNCSRSYYPSSPTPLIPMHCCFRARD